MGFLFLVLYQGVFISCSEVLYAIKYWKSSIRAGFKVGINDQIDNSDTITKKTSYIVALKQLRTYIGSLNESKSYQRSMDTGMDIIDQSAFLLELGDETKLLASNIFSEMQCRGLIRGSSTLLCSLASLYASCRRNEIPITLNDIAMVMNTSKKGIAREFRKLLLNTGINLPPINNKNYIIRYINELKLSAFTKELAISMLKIAKSKRLITGKDPAVIATAIIYIAGLFTSDCITQRALSDTALITEVSIRNNYKKLYSAIGSEMITHLMDEITTKHNEAIRVETKSQFNSENMLKTGFLTNGNESILQNNSNNFYKSKEHFSGNLKKKSVKKKITLDRFLNDDLNS